MKLAAGCLGLLALTAWSVAAPEASEAKFGQDDAKVLAALRELVSALPPHATLREIAPRFVVDRHEGLSWAEAVEEANRRFGGKQPERAAFLRRYIVKGMSKSQMQELQLPESGMSIGTGTGHSVSYVFGEREKPEATITVWIGAGETLVSDATIQLEAAEFHGVAYRYLAFDRSDTLERITRELPPETDGRKISIQAGVGADGALNFYSGWIQHPSGVMETMRFTPSLLLQEREVDGQPDRYREEYVEGQLRRRVHYRQRPSPDGKGTETYAAWTDQIP